MVQNVNFIINNKKYECQEHRAELVYPLMELWVYYENKVMTFFVPSNIGVLGLLACVSV